MSRIVGMGIDGSNNHVFAWYDNHSVTAGTSGDLSSRRKPYSYKLPAGKTPEDIVRMGIDGSNNWVFAWYRDGTVSVGTTRDLGSRKKPYNYQLPAGKTPDDIVGMGIDGSNNWVLAWYRDGTVSAGTSKNLSSRKNLYKYELPTGKTPGDIIGIAIDGFVLVKDPGKVIEIVGDATETEGEDIYTAILSAVKQLPKFLQSLTFAWYKDGTVSAGSSMNLSQVRVPYSYKR